MEVLYFVSDKSPKSTVVQKSSNKAFKMTKSRKHLVWRFAAATAAMCSVFVNPVLSIVNATNIDDEEKANMPSDSFCEDDVEMEMQLQKEKEKKHKATKGGG